MRREKGVWLAASYPHQLTYALSTSSLQSLTPPAGQMRQSALIRCSDCRGQKDQSGDWRLRSVEEMRAWVQTHRQTKGWREGSVTSDQGPARIRSL